jgi:chorismate lyase/3-hydroxybenzoate synthase
LLVGGTASVRGEDSVHLDDLPCQCRETYVNLAALVSAAIGKKLTPSVKLPRLLSTFSDLRVYYPDRAHEREIERSLRENFPNLRRLEMLHADLCRAELLVEIEGVADLNELKTT